MRGNITAVRVPQAIIHASITA